MLHRMTKGNRIIVAPFVELVRQIVHNIRSIYTTSEVIPLFGGSQTSLRKNTVNTVIIGAPETILTNIHKIKEVSVLIVDEAHLLDDPSRGWSIEKLINIIHTKNKNVWICLSTATLSRDSFIPLIQRYNMEYFIVPTKMGMNRKYILIVLQTGSGKTMIYGYMIHRVIKGNRIIVAPFVELVRQIVHNMRSIYTTSEVIPLFGGSQTSLRKNTVNPVIIGTPETILTNIHKIKEVSVLIVDEAHLIDDPSR
jgi:replicative superfamily II helicase